MSRLKKFRTCWGQQCSKCLEMKPFEAFDKQRLKTTGYRSHCKQCRNITYSAQYSTEKGRQRAQIGSWRSQGIVGMTIERYNSMLAAQGGVCAICGITEEQNGRRLCVDHNHDTGEVRALLCDHCNVGLGRFNDDPAVLLKALQYLEKYNMKVAV